MLKTGVISKVYQPTVRCAPMVVTPQQNGYSCTYKLILDIPVPTNVAEVRSFMGMVNQFNKFTSHLASKSKPLRDLLCKHSVWYWGEKQNESFNDLKKCLISVPILALYDPNKETKINADASSYGIGGVVLQKQENNEWKPVSYISSALTDTESRYNQIEKECLAFTWACERSSDYILGKSFSGETDHKPLVPLLTTHTLDHVPPRIQRFRMRLMRFNLEKMTHVYLVNKCTQVMHYRDC